MKANVNVLLRKLTMPELCHLFNLIARNEEDGTHTAPRAQYWARHKRVKAWLEAYAQQIYRPETKTK